MNSSPYFFFLLYEKCLSPYPSMGRLPLCPWLLRSLSRSFYSRCTFSIPKSIFCRYRSRLLPGWRTHEHRDLRLLCNPSSSPSHSSSLRLCSARHFPLFLIPPRGHSSAITYYLCCIFGILSSLHLFCVDPSLLQTSILSFYLCLSSGGQ